MKKDTAVIILNYKTWEETLNEARNIHEVLDVEWEDIIIIDNCSPNESGKKLKENSFLGYQYVENNVNNGYAAGNNIGLLYAYKNDYKYAWIVNNDIIISDKKLINSLRKVFDYDNKVAAVSPDICAPSGHMFNRDSVRPSFWDFTIGMFFYPIKGRKIHDKGGWGYVYRPQGCCMILDLQKTFEVGFMDEETFLYCEELILAERFLAKGYRCACCIESSVIHNHSTTVKNSLDQRRINNIMCNSFSYYLRKYRGYNKFKVKICCFFYLLRLKILG